MVAAALTRNRPSGDQLAATVLMRAIISSGEGMTMPRSSQVEVVSIPRRSMSSENEVSLAKFLSMRALTKLPEPWREVITPHADVASGRYQQAEFAADLWQVYLKEGSDEYRNPSEFFRRTFLTASLTKLLGSAMGPMALLMVGVTLAQTPIGGLWPRALALAALKNFLHPLLVVLAGWALGLTGVPLAVMVVAACLPIGANVFLFSQRYGVAMPLITASVAVSTMVALFSVSLVMLLAGAG